MAKIRVAITGGVGEGKSTVASYLRGLGIATINADDVARSVFRRDEVQKAIADRLQSGVPVEPEKVRAALANDPPFRRFLNSLTHPQIIEELRTSQAPAAEIPLLIETCLQGEYHRVWVVTCGPEEQLRRVTARLGDEAAAKRLIATQLPTRAKIAFADAVVRTNLPESNVFSFVSNLARSTFGE